MMPRREAKHVSSFVPERVRLFEFRRGVKRCVSISCLAFSACGTLLAASSNTETVHVFRLAEPPQPPQPQPQTDQPPTGATAGAGEAESSGWLGWLSSAVAAGAGLLPAQVADVLAQGRAFAAARLPIQPSRAMVAITNVGRAPRLLVATAGGELYVYALATAEGGDCTLLRTHRLLEPSTQVPVATDAHEESERDSELGAALEGSPPHGPFDLRDPRHFPPMRPQPAE